MQKFKELVKVTELVISNKKSSQELEFMKAVNVIETILLTVDFFNPEVCFNIVQVS